MTFTQAMAIAEEELGEAMKESDIGVVSAYALRAIGHALVAIALAIKESCPQQSEGKKFGSDEQCGKR